MHESLKKLIKAGVEVTESGFAAAADGKFNAIGDIMEFVDDIPEISAAFAVKEEIKDHLPDLKNPVVKEEAIQYFKDEFDIDNDKTEAEVEAFIDKLADTAVDLIGLLEAGKALFTKEAA